MKYLSLFLFLFTLHAEELAHECGVGLVFLRKPLSYYEKQYQDASWGTKKLLFLLEKQKNRGQEGAGIATLKLDQRRCEEYLHQARFAHQGSLEKLLVHVANDLASEEKRSPFVANVLLGHVRYATYAGQSVKHCQPFLREQDTPKSSFALAGNFNMTNTAELFAKLDSFGIFPTQDSDTAAVFHTLAYHLDQRSKEHLFSSHTSPSVPEKPFSEILKQTAPLWDGGYVFCGFLGNGEVFAYRDPAGIRPGYYYLDEEVLAFASERIALMETFEAPAHKIHPIPPGTLLSMSPSKPLIETQIQKPLEEKQCSFERIYFSKANDPSIYQERKKLGNLLAKRIYQELGGNLENTIFTFVPNSSISAFQGVVEKIAELAWHDRKEGASIQQVFPRVEYLIAKNQKIRTFIASDVQRKTLVSQLYEMTPNIVTDKDTLVVIDDSIVRGVTLKESIIPKLINLNPKKILFTSSAPPVLYPDCYGIDMSQIGRFVGFQAVVRLLQKRGQTELLSQIKERCQKQEGNAVQELYRPFSLEELEDEMAIMLRPPNIAWEGTLKILYQTLEGLHEALPNHKGDWYFSGNYPTPGGERVVNQSFLKWAINDDSRSY